MGILTAELNELAYELAGAIKIYAEDSSTTNCKVIEEIIRRGVESGQFTKYEKNRINYNKYRYIQIETRCVGDYAGKNHVSIAGRDVLGKPKSYKASSIWTVRSKKGMVIKKRGKWVNKYPDSQNPFVSTGYKVCGELYTIDESTWEILRMAIPEYQNESL